MKMCYLVIIVTNIIVSCNGLKSHVTKQKNPKTLIIIVRRMISEKNMAALDSLMEPPDDPDVSPYCKHADCAKICRNAEYPLGGYCVIYGCQCIPPSLNEKPPMPPKSTRPSQPKKTTRKPT